MWADMVKLNIVLILGCFSLFWHVGKAGQKGDLEGRGREIISFQEQLICFACRANKTPSDNEVYEHTAYLKAMVEFLNKMKNYTYVGSPNGIKDEQLVWMKKQVECVEYVLHGTSNFETDFYKKLTDGENPTYNEFWKQYKIDVLESVTTANISGTSACDIDQACNINPSADTTAGDTTAGDTTAGDTTSANTTAADTTSTNTTAANTTAANTTSANTTSADTTSADTTSANTTSANTTSANTTAADTTSANTTSADTVPPSNTSSSITTSTSYTTSASTSSSLTLTTTTTTQQEATSPPSNLTSKIRYNDAVFERNSNTTPGESSQNIALYITIPVLTVLVAIAALSFRAVKQRYSEFRRRLSASSELAQRKGTNNNNHNQAPTSKQEGRGHGQKDEKEDNSDDGHHYEDVYSLTKPKQKDTELQYDTVTSRISGVVDRQTSHEDERGYQMLGSPRVKTPQRGGSNQKESSENDQDCETVTGGEPLYEDLADIRDVGADAIYKSTVTFETDQRALQRAKARNVQSVPSVLSSELYSGNVEILPTILRKANTSSRHHANKRYSSGLDLARHPALRSTSTSPASSHRYSTNLDLSPASNPHLNLPSTTPPPEREEESAYETPDEIAVNRSHAHRIQSQWSRDVSPFVKSGGSPSFVPKNRYSTGLQLHSHPALIGLSPVSSPKHSVHSETSLCSAEVISEEYEVDEDPYEIPDEVKNAAVEGKDAQTSGESLYENNVFHNHSSSHLVSPAARAFQNQSRHQKICKNEEEEGDELYDQEHIYNSPD